MRHTLTIAGVFVAAATLLSDPAAWAVAQGAEASLAKMLDAKGTAQSVLFVRLSDGKALFEKEADSLVAPASVTKVVTSAAVLSRFSPVHTFKTQILHTGQRKNERILGDLVVVGDGDPFIVSEKLWQLAADLSAMGIREVTGDLVIDQTLFDDELRDEGRQGTAKSTHHAYDAPVTAFGVNFNTYALALAPGEAPGSPAHAVLDPYPLRHVVIDSSVRTSRTNVAKSVDVKRVDTRDGEKLVASGTVPAGGDVVKVYRSVGNPSRAAGEYLKAFLKASGVIVRGAVKDGPRSPQAVPLVTLESYDLRKIVSGLNTFSNNYIADVLVKRLGAAFPKSGTPEAAGSGNFENGMAALTDFLKKDVGIASPFKLYNGSGLDTANRLSARQVVAVLAHMEKRMDVFPEFLASLPASGWDGTMKKRFQKGEQSLVEGFIRAKTGTLTEPVSVAGLAGYFRHPSHGMVAFCILENGKEGQAQPPIADLRDRQDRVLTAFLSDP